MGLKLFTAPTEEPVNVAEAKLHARVSQDEDDVKIAQAIQAVRLQAESYTRRAFVTQVWDLFLTQFPVCDDRSPFGEIWLPKPPLASVGYVKYVDAAGVLQTLTAGVDYVVGTSGERGSVYPAYGRSWPVSRREPEAVRVRFTCGYGAALAVDPRAKLGILAWLVDIYDAVRGTFVTGTITSEPPFTAKHLLDSLRSLEPVGANQET